MFAESERSFRVKGALFLPVFINKLLILASFRLTLKKRSGKRICCVPFDLFPASFVSFSTFTETLSATRKSKKSVPSRSLMGEIFIEISFSLTE